jgi:iron(III) transport system permease protein
MTTIASEQAGALPRPRRPLFRAGGFHWLVWAFVVFTVVGPFVPLIYSSFRDRPLYEAGGAFTTDAYRQLLGDPAFWDAVGNTLQYAAITTLLAVVGGGMIGILVMRTDLPGRRAFGALVLLPLLLPALGIIVGWIEVWGPGGYVSGLLKQHLHVSAIPLDTVPGMALIEAVRLLPIAYITCRAALARADSSLEDAARSAGASPLRVIRSVTLPMLRPALLNSATLIFTLALASLGIPLLLGTPSNIQMVSTYLYNQWTNGATPDPPSVSAGAVLLLLVATLLLLLRNRLIGAEQRFVSIGGRGGRQALLPLGRWRWVIAIVLTLYLVLGVLLPVLGLGLTSIVSVLTPLIAPWELLTWANWTALAHGEFRTAIENSAIISLVGAVLATVVVMVATLVAHRSRFPLRRTLPFLLLYPRATPGIIIGIGFFWAYLVTGALGDWLRGSIWGIMVAFCVRNLPFAYIVMYPTMARIGDELDRASRSVGASWWRTSRSIVIPLLRPAIFASFAIMFIEILNDYDPAVFLVKPGTDVIGTTMLSQFQQGFVGQVAALAVVEVAVTVVVLLAMSRLFKLGALGGKSDA